MAVELRGSYTVAVTPFTPDGSSVDVAALKSFLDWQLAEKVPGIIMLGTTGEFVAVTDDERHQLVEETVNHINGRIPVLVGAMAASTKEAVRRSIEAEELGADGLMILPPFYYTPTDDEIFRHYQAISEAVQVPIMLYNNPVTSNVDMSAQLVARLARSFENVRYIKESSQELGRVRDVLEASDGLINVFAGERVVDSYLLGAVGYVNPYGNYIPRASAGFVQLAADGRYEEARTIQRLIDELDEIIAEGHPTYGHQCYSKELAARAGYPVGTVRPPLTTFDQLGEEGQERVKRILPIMERISQQAVQLGL
jgi:4-hydroxy-tetrahydrodipicolinate synthase